MMDGKEIVQMRMDGKTFQEIADFCGISKQAVHQKFKSYMRFLAGERGNTVDGRRFNINDIPYKGLHEYFKENEKENVSSFCRKMHGGKENTPFATKMRNFLTGANASHFTIEQIKAMCGIVGKPFEEVFENRGAVCMSTIEKGTNNEIRQVITANKE